MMDKKQLLELKTQIETSLERVNSFIAKSEAVEKVNEKWQPKGGDYLIMSNGEVTEALQTSINNTMAILFGMKRDTQEKAELAAKEMRRFNRLLALRDELCGDEIIDLGNMTGKFMVYFSRHKSKWFFTRSEDLQDVAVHFVCLESAKKAADMLNSGEVEL